MNALTYPVVILCIVSPAVASLFIRRRAGVEVDTKRVFRTRLHLWVGTALAVGFTVGLDLLDRAGHMQWWHDLPAYMTWRIPPGQLGWVLSFVLWFPLFMRVHAAVRPDLATPYPVDTGKRTAALVSRKRASPLGPGHWILGWAIFLTCAGLTAAGLAQGAGGSALGAGLTIVFAPLPLFVTPWGIRLVLREPEPLPAADSEDLARAYGRHRDRKIRGLWLMAILMVSMFSGLAVAAAWGAGGAAMGWVGGIGGSLLGVAGAAFGVVMSIDRARIKEMLDAAAGTI